MGVMREMNVKYLAQQIIPFPPTLQAGITACYILYFIGKSSILTI